MARRPRMARALLASLSAWGAAAAWPTSDDLAGIGNSRNLTLACERLRFEALQSCLEYAQLDFTPATCGPWQQEVNAKCYESNGNCTFIAEELREFCRFALQGVVSEPKIAYSYCVSTEIQFRDSRCPPSSYAPLNDTLCQTPEADDCMVECGNYQPCNCLKQRGTLKPDVCSGEVVIPGPLPPVLDSSSSRNYSCNTTNQPPIACRHHQPEGRCGMFKHCLPDLCVLGNVTCPNRTECEAWGECDPREGWCKYRFKPDGSECDDGVDFTLQDQCIKGVCEGTVDYCLKYNTTCVPQSECLTGGVCNSKSGRCVFDKKPDGTSCDDGREYTVEDRCSQGICLGKVINLCIERGIVCEPPNSCYDPGVCDPLTGICSDPSAASDNRFCNDGNAQTVNETCIDGICLGEPADIVYEFLTLPGTGKCVDRDNREMGRYSGDVPEGEDACKNICVNDVQCLAYGYAYPLCSIYGTVRTRAPNDGRPWAFQLGTDPPAVAIEQVSPPTRGQRAMVCRKKGGRADTLADFAKFEANREDWFGFDQVFAGSIICVLLFAMWPFLTFLPRLMCPSRFGDATEVKAMDSQEPTPPASPVNRQLSKKDALRAAKADAKAAKAGKAALPPPEALGPEALGPPPQREALQAPPAPIGEVSDAPEPPREEHPRSGAAVVA